MPRRMAPAQAPANTRGMARVGRVIALLVLATRSGFASAPDEPAGSAPALSRDESQRLEQAKELFRQGNELRKVGDFQRALDFYRRSRRLVPSVPNTLNAAFCLQQLGRYDEALQLYENLLTTERRVQRVGNRG